MSFDGMHNRHIHMKCKMLRSSIFEYNRKAGIGGKHLESNPGNNMKIGWNIFKLQ